MKRSLSRRDFVAATTLLVFAGRAKSARADALDDAIAKMNKEREGLKSLSGPFTQERTIGLLAAKVTSTGTLTLVRPDRLRWELAPPDAVVYWIGPEGLAFQSSRGEKGRLPPTQARIAAALEDLRLVLGGDLGGLRARYDLTLTSQTDAVMAFSAVPKDKASKLRRIDFELLTRGALPKKVVLIDGPKDKTEIAFGDLARNPTIDPALMRPNF
jgi:outer membrane lipoprotein-sorting protein